MIAALLANVLFNLAMHPYLGAITLGLGNTAYSLILLAGTLTSLKLWREFINRSRIIALGGIGYLLISYYLPSSTNIWKELAIVMVFAACYWMLWICLMPSLRTVLVGILKQKRGESV